MLSTKGRINLNELESLVISLEDSLARCKKCLQRFTKDKIDINSLALSELIDICSLLTPQAKSPIYERWILSHFDLKPLSASLGRGDGIDANGNTYEVKISSSNSNKKINIRQIRLFQPIDYYIIGYIDDKENKNTIFYLLTHSQMSQEINKHGCPTHNTSYYNKSNDNIEYSITLKIDSEQEKGWREKYGISIF